ncbi:MAG: hypothetical protein IT379_05085 [Deltaproteobacteria bacterium]|nr:hypothetical protein [Deltaproteobacteria bacterium]
MVGGQRSAGTRATVIVERLRRLEHALVAPRGRGRTVDELVALVGTSRSTLYRDLGFLARSGVAIVEQRLDGKTLRRIDATDRPRLTSEQVHALRLARALLAPLEGSALVRDVDALLALQPTHARRPLASTPTAPQTTRPDVVARVERACRTRRQLRFTPVCGSMSTIWRYRAPAPLKPQTMPSRAPRSRSPTIWRYRAPAPLKRQSEC